MDANPKSKLMSSNRLALQQRTRCSPRLREKDLLNAANAVMFQVLDNPSLREEILTHVIFGKDGSVHPSLREEIPTHLIRRRRDGSVDRSAACDLRLVSKNWNDSVLRILWKRHEHLFQLSDKEYLTEFVKTFAASSSSQLHFPPLSLSYLSELVISGPETFGALSNCLNLLGPGLLQLDVKVTDNGSRSHSAPLPVWSLQRVHKMCLNFEPQIGVPVAADGEETTSSALAKSILHGATALGELDLSVFIPEHERAPTNPTSGLLILESVTLPGSLSKISMIVGDRTHRSNDNLEILVRSQIPKLRILELMPEGEALANGRNGYLFRILEKCAASLEKCFVRVSGGERPPPNVHLIPRFPVMTKLKEFSIWSMTAELESDLRSLENCFPALESLRLGYLTAEILGKWTRHSKFSSVTSLQFILVEIGGNGDGIIAPNNNLPFPSATSLNARAMQGVNFAFPNLRKLEIGVSSRVTSGLCYIFMEMRQLTHLRLEVDGDFGDARSAAEISSNVWDSILTGVPEEMIEEAGERDEVEDEALASIKNLQELTSFGIGLELEHYYFGRGRPRSFISDLTFDLALLKMPKLTRLILQGPFIASRRMTEKWRDQGRTLVYNRIGQSPLLNFYN